MSTMIFFSFFASADFVNKTTDSGIYGNFGQHITFIFLVEQFLLNDFLFIFIT
jgi:hypothetical protein